MEGIVVTLVGSHTLLRMKCSYHYKVIYKQETEFKLCMTVNML